MSGIPTNSGAMATVQTRRGIDSAPETIQSEIATGKTVANARDSAALWPIPKGMEADVSGHKAIASSMSPASSAIATARNGAQQIDKLLTQRTDSVTSGLDALADADIETASARLKALQTQQQLGARSPSTTNNAPQTLLSLFR